MNNINQLSSLIWSIADDVLRGTFKPNEYGRIILPFVVLRRLDCVLEQNKDLAITTFESYKDKIEDPEDVVLKKLQLSFYNISKYDLEKLKSDPTNIKQNFENYIQGYSENVRGIIKNFNLQPLVDKNIEMFNTLRENQPAKNRIFQAIYRNYLNDLKTI